MQQYWSIINASLLFFADAYELEKMFPLFTVHVDDGLGLSPTNQPMCV